MRTFFTVLFVFFLIWSLFLLLGFCSCLAYCYLVLTEKEVTVSINREESVERKRLNRKKKD